ncbi:helix-turn-helix domain-containing protein [Limosilactobacillus reuteri]|uniref:helix-turn-helix domain-containing protein n=1 Tax=Limosilactobacillus reuteri TaxID=1598 RepID=UPI003D9703C8
MKKDRKKTKENDIGRKVSKYRREAGMSQEKLAEIAQVSVGYLSKVERSIPTNISVTVLLRVAQALNITLDDLVYDSNNSSQTDSRINQTPLNNLLDQMDVETSEQLCQNIINSIQLLED